MTLSTLAWLLFQANSGRPSKDFYKIKEEILAKFGSFEGFDIQEIEGKKCFTCDGTGNVFINYWSEFEVEREDCQYCLGNGWYKDPFKCILRKYSLNGYNFHVPVKKIINDQQDLPVSMKGYVEKEEQEFCQQAREILITLYKNNLHLEVEELESLPF